MRPVSVGGHVGRNDAIPPAASAMSGLSAAAKASLVNRTHRVVRERARTMQADRSKIRGLLLPLTLCSVLMILIYSALWTLVEQYESVSPEAPAESHHLFMLLLWFLPASAALVAMVWYRRSRSQADTEATR
jgi:hypothetical protein